MNKLILLICLTVLIAGCCKKSNKKDDMVAINNETENQIFPKGKLIKNDYFSGKAWLQMLMTNKDDFDLTIGNVVFEAGVRNNWHSHPGGQILLCTDGEGYYQEKGKPIRLLHKGDIVEILPNVVHWHGASPKSDFTHIAITTQAHKGSVIWLDPVTDEEYNSYKK